MQLGFVLGIALGLCFEKLIMDIMYVKDIHSLRK